MRLSQTFHRHEDLSLPTREPGFYIFHEYRPVFRAHHLRLYMNHQCVYKPLLYDKIQRAPHRSNYRQFQRHNDVIHAHSCHRYTYPAAYVRPLALQVSEFSLNRKCHDHHSCSKFLFPSRLSSNQRVQHPTITGCKKREQKTKSLNVIFCIQHKNQNLVTNLSKGKELLLSTRNNKCLN